MLIVTTQRFVFRLRRSCDVHCRLLSKFKFNGHCIMAVDDRCTFLISLLETSRGIIRQPGKRGEKIYHGTQTCTGACRSCLPSMRSSLWRHCEQTPVRATLTPSKAKRPCSASARLEYLHLDWNPATPGWQKNICQM